MNNLTISQEIRNLILSLGANRCWIATPEWSIYFTPNADFFLGFVTGAVLGVLAFFVLWQGLQMPRKRRFGLMCGIACFFVLRTLFPNHAQASSACNGGSGGGGGGGSGGGGDGVPPIVGEPSII